MCRRPMIGSEKLSGRHLGQIWDSRVWATLLHFFFSRFFFFGRTYTHVTCMYYVYISRVWATLLRFFFLVFSSLAGRIHMCHTYWYTVYIICMYVYISPPWQRITNFRQFMCIIRSHQSTASPAASASADCHRHRHRHIAHPLSPSPQSPARSFVFFLSHGRRLG